MNETSSPPPTPLNGGLVADMAKPEEPLKLPPLTEPLPEHRQAQVAAGLATYQSVLAERDMLDGELSKACKTIASLTVQLDALKSVVNMMESSYTSARLELENRVREYQAQRDDAVRAAAKADAVVENIYVVAHNAIEEAKNARG